MRFGERCGLERDEVWRKMWFGERCGLEKDVVRREMWFSTINYWGTTHLRTVFTSKTDTRG